MILKVNKKEFHYSKQPLALDLLQIDKRVISDKVKHSDKGSNILLAMKMTI